MAYFDITPDTVPAELNTMIIGADRANSHVVRIPDTVGLEAWYPHLQEIAINTGREFGSVATEEGLKHIHAPARQSIVAVVIPSPEAR